MNVGQRDGEIADTGFLLLPSMTIQMNELYLTQHHSVALLCSLFLAMLNLE